MYEPRDTDEWIAELEGLLALPNRRPEDYAFWRMRLDQLEKRKEQAA